MTAASTANDLFDRYRVIDVDTHLTEPPDVWTTRVASKWGDLVPHIERRDGEDAWVVSALPEATVAKVLHDNAARVYDVH